MVALTCVVAALTLVVLMAAVVWQSVTSPLWGCYHWFAGSLTTLGELLVAVLEAAADAARG